MQLALSTDYVRTDETKCQLSEGGRRMLYAIKKDGKYVKDFSDGAELTLSRQWVERYYTKKGAIRQAQEYGRRYGKGFTVVEFL